MWALVPRKFWWKCKGNHYAHLDWIVDFFLLYSFEKITSPWRREMNVCVTQNLNQEQTLHDFWHAKKKLFQSDSHFITLLRIKFPYSLIIFFAKSIIGMQLPFLNSLLKTHWLFLSNTIINGDNVSKETIWFLKNNYDERVFNMVINSPNRDRSLI